MRPTRALLLVLLLVLLVSCSKADFQVSNLQSLPYVHRDGGMGLCVYVMTDADDPSSMQMTVHDPSGNLSWSFNATEAKVGEDVYYGSSSVAMPSGVPLPKGSWSVDVMYKDGSKESLSFEISYEDADSAIATYEALGLDGAYFDAQSNLTVIP